MFMEHDNKVLISCTQHLLFMAFKDMAWGWFNQVFYNDSRQWERRSKKAQCSANPAEINLWQLYFSDGISCLQKN